MLTPEQQAALEAVDPEGLSRYALAVAYFKAGCAYQQKVDAALCDSLAHRSVRECAAEIRKSHD